MTPYPRTSPNQNQRTSHNLRRYIAAPGPPPVGHSAPVENRSCVRKTSGPTASAKPAAPPAGRIGPTPSGCQAHLLHHAGGSGPFPIGCNFENGLVTRFLSA